MTSDASGSLDSRGSGAVRPIRSDSSVLRVRLEPLLRVRWRRRRRRAEASRAEASAMTAAEAAEDSLLMAACYLMPVRANVWFEGTKQPGRQVVPMGTTALGLTQHPDTEWLPSARSYA